MDPIEDNLIRHSGSSLEMTQEEVARFRNHLDHLNKQSHSLQMLNYQPDSNIINLNIISDSKPNKNDSNQHLLPAVTRNAMEQPLQGENSDGVRRKQ